MVIFYLVESPNASEQKRFISRSAEGRITTYSYRHYTNVYRCHVPPYRRRSFGFHATIIITFTTIVYT